MSKKSVNYHLGQLGIALGGLASVLRERRHSEEARRYRERSARLNEAYLGLAREKHEFDRLKYGDERADKEFNQITKYIEGQATERRAQAKSKADLAQTEAYTERLRAGTETERAHQELYRAQAQKYLAEAESEKMEELGTRLNAEQEDVKRAKGIVDMIIGDLGGDGGLADVTTTGDLADYLYERAVEEGAETPEEIQDFVRSFMTEKLSKLGSGISSELTSKAKDLILTRMHDIGRHIAEKAMRRQMAPSEQAEIQEREQAEEDRARRESFQKAEAGGPQEMYEYLHGEREREAGGPVERPASYRTARIQGQPGGERMGPGILGLRKPSLPWDRPRPQAQEVFQTPAHQQQREQWEQAPTHPWSGQARTLEEFLFGVKPSMGFMESQGDLPSVEEIAGMMRRAQAGDQEVMPFIQQLLQEAGIPGADAGGPQVTPPMAAPQSGLAEPDMVQAFQRMMAEVGGRR
jgi:hypothetical protein